MKMEAAVAYGIGQVLKIETIDIAEPRDDEVLVRNVATGICHTDMAMRDHMIYPVPHPVVLGHEGAGVVEKVGRGVTKVRPGDHVVLNFAFCGECASCHAHRCSYCTDFNKLNFYGTRPDGTSPLSCDGGLVNRLQGQSSFAQYSVVQERSVVRVRKDVPLEYLGPLGCGIQTGTGAVINSLGVSIDDSIAVFGTGSVGLAGIMGAKLVGAGIIIAVDIVDGRLELARELGATHTINPKREDMVARIMEITGGEGLNYALDTTANMKVLKQGMDVLAKRGTCGFVGGAPKGMEVVVDVEHMMTGGRSLRGIILGDSDPEVFLPRLIDLFALGRFPLDKLVTFYPFAKINEAIHDSETGKAVKAVVKF